MDDYKKLNNFTIFKGEINNWDQFELDWLETIFHILFYLGFQPYLNSDLKREKLGKFLYEQYL